MKSSNIAKTIVVSVFMLFFVSSLTYAQTKREPVVTDPIKKTVLTKGTYTAPSPLPLRLGHMDKGTFTAGLSITANGNVGIGTSAPSSELEIASDDLDGARLVLDNTIQGLGIGAIEFRSEGERMGRIQSSSYKYPPTVSKNSEGVLTFETSNGGTLYQRMVIDHDGNVGIGTPDTKGYKLAVDGKVLAEEIRVQLSTDWSDFVFDEDYELRTLAEVEDYINENHHLPDIPDATTVETEGLSLGGMQAKLLQKIEELTLYMIEQEKKLEKMSTKLTNLENENKGLKGKLTTSRKN